MYSFYKITLIGTLIAACSVLLTTTITAEPRSTPRAGENSSIVLPTSANGILSQCGDYFTFNPETSYYGVVPSEYDRDTIPVPPMTVPVYGFMEAKAFDVEKASKLKQGENPYKIAAINRAMWDGHTFIWIEKTVPAETYNYIKSYAAEWNKTHENKVIPLTWTAEKSLPQKRTFAFSSWNTSQSCRSFSESAFEEYMEQVAQQNSGRALKPVPVATLKADGTLPKR
jgi:hypothetical protein